uniref:Tetratricopeptide repeat domain-containing protein n=1 Tax=Chloropicon primus TaxID=1764295 RepID=A0A7S2T5B5_9CHLO|mmetsp:Transcript_6240/g.18568  ORF Transcript_6240/g.18568 Transcript_6240/m.18568 type:complete len:498 (+) Transcript_6240:60-1553(+)
MASSSRLWTTARVALSALAARDAGGRLNQSQAPHAFLLPAIGGVAGLGLACSKVHSEEECSDCANEGRTETTVNTPNKHSTAKWRVFTDRARDLHQQGKIEEARAFFQRALEEAEKGFGPEDEHLAASYQNLAELLRINREFEEAEALYQKAIALLESKSKKRAARSPEASKFERNNFISEPVRQKALATTVDHLCGIYLQMQPKKLEDARDCYQKALKLKLEAFGGHHIEVANTLARAAQVSELQGRHRQAIDLMGQSVDCLLKNQGNEDESGRTILNDSVMKLFRVRTLQLANLLLRQESESETREAEEVLRRLINLTMQSGGQGEEEASCDENDLIGRDPQVCNLFCQALVASRDPGRCEKAVALLEPLKDRLLSAKASSLQKDLSECAISRHLGEAYLCLGREEELKSLNLEDVEQRIFALWDDLRRGKQGLPKRLLAPVTFELLGLLGVSSRVASDPARKREILGIVEKIVASSGNNSDVEKVATKVKASMP